jgi:DhnA family fructose-bisphosphate aldolase class Ia
MAMEGKAQGMPLVVEVRADGPRVSLPGKAVELGASYALEGGADVVVVPYPGLKSLETVAAFVSVPWLIKPSGSDRAAAELAEALPLGCAGLWIDHTIFAAPEPGKALASLGAMLHQPVAI